MPSLLGALFSLLWKKLMPTYDLRNTKTGETKEFIVSISKKEEMVASGEWQQVHLAAPRDVTHVGSMISKTGSDWSDHLKNIKKSTGKRVKNTINV